MTISRRFASLCVLGALALAFEGCSSASGPSLNPDKSNCKVVCDKAHDCIDDKLDTDSCTTKCDDQADDDVFAAKVKECAECAEPKACTEVSGCTGDCLRIYLP